MGDAQDSRTRELFTEALVGRRGDPDPGLPSELLAQTVEIVPAGLSRRDEPQPEAELREPLADEACRRDERFDSSAGGSSRNEADGRLGREWPASNVFRVR